MGALAGALHSQQRRFRARAVEDHISELVAPRPVLQALLDASGAGALAFTPADLATFAETHGGA
jgi:hypothetical protein